MYTPAIHLFAKNIRLAQLATAKKDIRHYLEGVFFDKENNKIVGTNGNSIVVTNMDLSNIEKSIILKFEKPIGASIERVIIRPESETQWIVECYGKKELKGTMKAETIEGYYPDYQQIISPYEGGSQNAEDNWKVEIALASDTLSLIPQVFKKQQTKMTYLQGHNVIKFNVIGDNSINLYGGVVNLL